MPLSIILNAIGSSFLFSQFFALEREVAAGGLTNRNWSVFYQIILTGCALAPFTIVFPSSIALELMYYSAIALAGLLGYSAYVCHTNQLNEQQNETDRKKLPYDLQDNPRFSKAVRFLNYYFSYFLFAGYSAAIALCLYSGFGVFAYASLSTLFIDQVVQRGWLSESLTKTYNWAGLLLMLTYPFGIGSWISIGLTTLFVGYTVWDLFSTHVWKNKSGSILFQMADIKKRFDLNEYIPRNQLGRSQRIQTLAELDLAMSACRVTYNHFQQSYVITDKLSRHVPEVDFREFLTLFDEIDFTNEALTESILAQFSAQDAFFEKTYAEHRQDLNLPPNATEHNVRVAYLRKEMEWTIQRLQEGRTRDLPQVIITTMTNQARHLLHYLKNDAGPEKQGLLLDIAFRTGSHCNRMYVDTFSELFHHYIAQEEAAELTLQERVVLAAQSYREECFKNYYYEAVAILKEYNPVYCALYADPNDYHTYEEFVGAFGANFYLPNACLGRQIKTPFDLLYDNFVNPLLFEVYQIKTFDEFYSVDALIDATLNPRHELHHLFRTWCENVDSELFHQIRLDNDWMPRESDDPCLRGMAKMMLLDNGIIELEQPLHFYILHDDSEEVSSPTSGELLTETYTSTPWPFFGQPRSQVNSSFPDNDMPLNANNVHSL